MNERGGRLDVVVVAYESADIIEDCIRLALDVPGVGTIVVVDHGSDGSGELARNARALVVLDPSNPGFGSGQNNGVARTSAPAVLLLNPDARLVPEAISAGLDLLDERPEVAAVQGVILNGAGEPERSSGVLVGPVHLAGRAMGAARLLRLAPVRRRMARSPTLADHVRRRPDRATEVDGLAATAVLVRRDAFDSVGGFDERYFLYGEDLDLCRRLTSAGWTLVALPEVWACHRNGASSASSWEREVHWWRGTMSYAARWWGRADWSLALAAAAVRWIGLTLRRPRQVGRAWRSLISGPRRDRREQAVAHERDRARMPSTRP